MVPQSTDAEQLCDTLVELYTLVVDEKTSISDIVFDKDRELAKKIDRLLNIPSKVATVYIGQDELYSPADFANEEQWWGWHVERFERQEDFDQYWKGVDSHNCLVPADDEVKDLYESGKLLVLDKYEHSAEHWSLEGEGPQCRWDTTKYGGVLLWVGDEGFPEDWRERKAEARKFLDRYTNYVNGWVTRVVIDDSTPVTYSMGGLLTEEDIIAYLEDELEPGTIYHAEGPAMEIVELLRGYKPVDSNAQYMFTLE